MPATVRVGTRTALANLTRNFARLAAAPLFCSVLLAGCAPDVADEAADRAPRGEVLTAQAQSAAALPRAAAATGLVTAERLLDADSDVGNWLMDGRTYDAQRYSPLALINEENVGELGLAWYYDLETLRGVEATPLAIDGVIYNISAWNVTYAHDAKTGELLWTYDPEVSRESGRYACCEPVSRGLAAWQDKIIIATLDGRLIALDRVTGEPVWSVRTFTNDEWPYSITGAPRVFDGKVVVGNSGADFGVRGFVVAYDADDGEFLWKFYLVPGNPADGFENEAMEMAAKTWNGEWWTLGGGGTAWDSIAYDPELKLVYVGTGNGSPIVRHFRSPGGGDNLFLCSIVALDVETGEYRWHYQETPGEEWDYTCTQSIIQADLTIDGRERKVLLHAPKNGFFYVLDRATGELISAEKFVAVNWASHIDLATGRPVENPETRYGLEPALVTPGPGGGHNWFPMAYNPETKLAYFPTYEHWFIFARDETFRPVPFRSNGGWGGYGGQALAKRMQLQRQAPPERAWLTAWDPVKQEAAWRIELPRHGNGGVLTTAGNLVIEGTTKQTFSIFRATDGELLWEMPVQTAPVAGPITFLVDGEQYIAVNAGWGGGAAQVERGAGTALHRAEARLLVFKLGGTAELPPLPEAAPVPNPPPLRGTEEQIRRGGQIYAQTCAQCHGQLAVGGVKDLRHMTTATHAAFNAIVLEGTLAEKGMASFASLLSREDVEAVHAYLIARANEDWGDNSTLKDLEALPPPVIQ